MRRILKSYSGTAAIEMALVLPLLLAILFGIIEFGAVLYNKAVISNASRVAARYAAGFYTNPATAELEHPQCGDIQNFVTDFLEQNMFFLNFKNKVSFDANTNVKCCSGGTCTTSTNPRYFDAAAAIPEYVQTIRVEYQYNWLILGSVLGLATRSPSSYTSITLASQTTMRDENQN